MITKLKITKNSQVTVTEWAETLKYASLLFPTSPETRKVYSVKEGIVKDAIGNTVKIEFTIFKFLFFKIWKTKWFSFNDERYTINIKGSKKS